MRGGEADTGAVTYLFFSSNTRCVLSCCWCLFSFFCFSCQSSVVGRLPSWQTSLCMDDDGEWTKTAATAPGVPEDAVQPTPDDLAYIVMRQIGTR